ncbi:hypothetical protein LQ759_18880 [Serratia marcescens]|uniref:hypothetical protein n=1 Tax=Serratia TaxID=613 RepID=UPI001F303AA6|nr:MULTISPECIES: hypothetical protein [Serratia]MCF1611954.1 hypothetical protein [Serratia marcescens]MDI6973399.1 hypothetical protein [Serratia sp. Se-RSBMAAmG]MDI9262368.1 hypothetical protein [Serratia sp. PF2-63]MDI9271220.1 hypothetical protein [Serratia sp. PF-27]CAI1530750.1 Uncharacterised protein [Serratia marcescens]
MSTQAPFFAAANRVLRMYELRQQQITCRAPHSQTEIEWAADLLLGLAGAAAFSASKEAVSLRDAAEYWKRYGKQPDFFPETIEA